MNYLNEIKAIVKSVNEEYFQLSDNEDIRHLEMQNRMLTRLNFAIGIFAIIGWITALKGGK